MDCRRRLLLLLPALLAVLPASGCSSVGGLFGLTPPAHKLIPAAEQLRSAAATPAPLPRELNKALLPAYVVEPGDTLLVIPARLDSPIRLPGDQTVMQDGTIDLGEFGRPVVAGKTLPAIQSEITGLIAAKDKTAAPAIDVRLVGRVSKVYYVLGEVNAPGAFPIQGRETALDGIIAAGGITRRASTKKIILSRPTQPDGCRVVLPICYDNIVQLGDTSTNYQLMPGDRIYVASKGMLDDLCPGRSNKGCSACNGPQIPCPIGGGACAEPTPGIAPVMPAPAFPQTGTLPPAH